MKKTIITLLACLVFVGCGMTEKEFDKCAEKEMKKQITTKEHCEKLGMVVNINRLRRTCGIGEAYCTMPISNINITN